MADAFNLVGTSNMGESNRSEVNYYGRRIVYIPTGYGRVLSRGRFKHLVYGGTFMQKHGYLHHVQLYPGKRAPDGTKQFIPSRY
nr:hypothetical protein [Candidatus Sigynarchaeota archaeon]